MDTKIAKKILFNLYSFSPLIKMYTFLKMYILPFKEFSADLPVSGLFVDVGTGFGYMANFSALQSARRNVVGIDIDSKRIAIAKKTIHKRTNINFICADIRNAADIDNIDIVTMADVLHHIPVSDHKGFLESIYRKIKKGGRFIIRETNKKNSVKYYIMNYLSEVILYPFSERCHFYKADELKDLLEQTGFEITNKILSKPWFIYETVIYICRK